MAQRLKGLFRAEEKLVEHRGVSSRASPVLGQPGSDSPPGCHSHSGELA